MRMFGSVTRLADWSRGPRVGELTLETPLTGPGEQVGGPQGISRASGAWQGLGWAAEALNVRARVPTNRRGRERLQSPRAETALESLAP